MLSLEQGQVIVGIVSFIVGLYYDKIKNRIVRIPSYFITPLLISCVMYFLPHICSKNMDEVLLWAPLFIIHFYFAGIMGSFLSIIIKKNFKKIIR